MKKKELVEFVLIVENQFNTNKQMIIEGYEQYLKESHDLGYKTMCIESWGVAMIGTNNEDLQHLPFKELYNFINSFRGFAKDRHQYEFEKKPDCFIEYYTNHFLSQVQSFGVEKVLESLKY